MNPAANPNSNTNSNPTSASSSPRASRPPAPDLDELSPLQAALQLILDPTTSAETLASEMLTTPNQLAAWSDLPKLQQLLETLEKIYQARARLIAAEALPSAINILTHLVREADFSTPQSQEVARRAAVGIIKLATRPRGQGPAQATSPTAPSPPPSAPSPPRDPANSDSTTHSPDAATTGPDAPTPRAQQASGVGHLDSGCQQSLVALDERLPTNRNPPRGPPEAGDPRNPADLDGTRALFRGHARRKNGHLRRGALTWYPVTGADLPQKRFVDSESEDASCQTLALVHSMRNTRRWC